MSKRSKTQEKVEEFVAQAGAVASQAAEKIRPMAEEAVTFASEAKDKAVDKAKNDYLPKAKRVAHAAVDAARESDGSVKERAKAVSEAAASAVKEPKAKKKCCRRFFKTLVVLGGAVGATYLVWKRSQPVEDPWAESYWEDVTEESEDLEVEELVKEASEEDFSSEEDSSGEEGKHKA